jgi:hypothetical protein
MKWSDSTMPPAERLMTGYLARALASGAQSFRFRTGARTLLTGVDTAASLHGVPQPLPGYSYASPAPPFNLHGTMEFPTAVAAPTAPAAARTPASLQTGSSVGVSPRMVRSESADENSTQPSSAARQTGADVPHVEHQRYRSDAKTETRLETQAVSIAPQLIAIPKPNYIVLANWASAARLKGAAFAPNAPPFPDHAGKHDPITNVNPRPADLRLSRDPVERVAKLPNTAIGPPPNLALFPTVPPHVPHTARRAHANLVSEAPEQSPSPQPTPPHVSLPNSRMAPFDRAASGQRAPHSQAPRPELARTTPTRAPLDPTQQRALRTLEQLRHSVQALVSKPQAAPSAAATPVVRPPASPAPKVVVVRPSAERSRHGSAFWERRYLGHPQLRVFR